MQPVAAAVLKHFQAKIPPSLKVSLGTVADCTMQHCYSLDSVGRLSSLGTPIIQPLKNGQVEFAINDVNMDCDIQVSRWDTLNDPKSSKRHPIRSNFGVSMKGSSFSVKLQLGAKSDGAPDIRVVDMKPHLRMRYHLGGYFDPVSKWMISKALGFTFKPLVSKML